MPCGPRHLIRRGSAARPVDEFLVEPAQMTFEWSRDRAAARGFASKGEAERFGRNLLAGPFNVVESRHVG